jgi:hypothetical protein
LTGYQLFELTTLGGPWARRLSSRRAPAVDLPWHEATREVPEAALEQARWVWTQSAFSEYASGAAFAEIASALLAAAAPIDLVAAAGDFVADEMLHAELSGRVAMAFGGAVALDVDLARLVRPAASGSPLLRAAELIVRTSCVGEALTVPVLKSARAHAGSELVQAVIAQIVADESAHAELGGWFLDWASDRFSENDRVRLGAVAGAALSSFAPVRSRSCNAAAGLGVLDCDAFDSTFVRAVEERVVRPLAARGIVVPPETIAALVC